MNSISTLKQRDSYRLLVSEARSGTEQISVKPNRVPIFEDDGWTVKKKGKTKVRLERGLPDHKKFERKVWLLFYLMGFDELSGLDGAIISRPSGTTNQIDVLAVSEDMTAVIECKSSGSSNSKAFDANQDIPKLKDNVNEIRRIFREEGRSASKLKGIVCLSGIRPSKSDRARAADASVKLLDESTVDYYIELSSRIGAAAYYQFVSELIGGEETPSLKDIKVPCVKTRIGSAVAYQLALTPELLLKLAYVSHRASGQDGGYQRMVTRSRIKSMQEFIDQGGFFPTNIVINFRSDLARPVFEPASVEYSSTEAKFGMLRLPSSFGCAWVIDGQHRLLSYAGHKWAATASLPVTAFEGLDRSKEAQLFEEINSKQKKVSAALLSELYASLHMGNPNAKYQIRAMASSTVERLKADRAGNFFGKILGADEKGSDTKCITVKQLTDELAKVGFYFWKLNGEKIQTPGPFWLGDPFDSVGRAAEILQAWFRSVRAGAEAEWAQGEHGIVATNRGVVACLRLLRDVFLRLRRADPDFDSWDEDAIAEAIEPFGLVAGIAFHQLRDTDFEVARTTYGSSAGPEYHFTIVKFLRGEGYPDFVSEGFEEWVAEKDSVNVDSALKLIRDLEKALLSFVIAEMAKVYADPWSEVPVEIRKAAASKREDTDPNGDIWDFLNLIDIRKIAIKHWSLFKEHLGNGMQGKEEGTKWISELSDIRNAGYHAGGSRLKSVHVAVLKKFHQDLTEAGVIKR